MHAPSTSWAVAAALLLLGPAAVVLPAAAECGDASTDVPFTRALYNQGFVAYNKATCIKEKEFCPKSFEWTGCNDPGGDIILDKGMPNLVTIDTCAFYKFAGRLVLALSLIHI